MWWGRWEGLSGCLYIKLVQSTMLGGLLQKLSLVVVRELDLLIVAFSHQLHFFSLAEATLLRVVALHENNILALHYRQEDKVVSTIDSKGNLLTFKLSAKGEPEEVTRQAGLFERNELRSASIFMNSSNEIQYYSCTSSSEVMCYTKEAVFPVHSESGDILFVSTQWLVLSNGQNKLQIIENGNWQTKFTYQHKYPITSVAVYQTSLLVGDERGKITQLVDFLVEGKTRLTQKLQWHVHAVKSLFVEGSYLYSSGEEGVVVVWHLRENKKDFLPRIGSEIEKVILDGATLYCMLSDNTIKSIDFSNDKAVLQYKVVVSPLAHHIDSSSLQLAKSNLVRVSPLADRLWMRSQPGRIQQVDLHSGINREFNIVSRNLISRLDEAFPVPHQLTDLCFSPDNSQMVVAVEGVHCRGLRFYAYDRNDFQLISKVENCHSGSKQIKLLWIGEGKFASYTDDKSVKVWKQAVRRKQSIMEIDEHFWCCDYEFNFRSQIPLHLSYSNNRLVITYRHELVFFNTVTKSIEHVYQTDKKKSEIVAVYQLPNNLLIVYKKSIEVAKEQKGSLVSTHTLLNLPQQIQIASENIVFNAVNHKFALLIGKHIFVQEDTTVTHLELGETQQIGDIFWFENRLIAIDSNRLFHDVTHNQPLLTLQNKDRTFQIEENTAQEITNLDYSQISRRYLGRQWAKERAGVERLSESMGIAPSVTSCFQLLAHQIFI